MSESAPSDPQPALSGSRPVIGLAGGIGSGKSTVAAILEDLGCVVDNADESVRMLLSDPGVQDELVSWWGQGILNADGQIDRSAVARIVFADPVQRRRMEGLIHPLVHQRRIREWNQRESDPRVVAFVIDAPLVFEAHLDGQCDAVIFIESEVANRQQRVTDHRGWAPDELPRREKNQMPLETKRDRSDYSLINNGTIDELRDRVQLTLRQILTAHSRRSRTTSDSGRADVKPQS